LTEVPAGIAVGLVQVTVWPTAPQVHPVPVAETKPRPVGNVSVTVTVPVVGSDPVEFATVIVYTPFEPTVKLPTWVFVMERSGARMLVVTLEVLFAADGSVTPAGGVTVAVLVVLPTPLAVPEIVIETVPPAGSVGIVLVTGLPATFMVPQTAPPDAPVQVAVTAVMAAGTGSEKVVPFAASGPAFDTVIV